MSILRKIQEAIEASRSASDVAVNENPGHLTISGTFSRSALDAWQAVSDGIESWFSLECADGSQDIIPPGCGVELERHRITIKFSAISGVAHIFTREGWRIFLHNSGFIAATHEVRLGFTKCTFSTRWFTIEPWTSQPSAKTAPERSQNKSNSPRRQVRSHSSNFMAPPLIEPWILLGSEPNEDPAVSIWKEISIQMTAKALPNELYMDGESQKIAIAGQPTRKLNLGKTPPSGSLFSDLQEATSWIYLEGEDIEVRHTFLSSELAREWPADTDFFDALPTKLNIALDSARLLYKAHLRSGSKDTLKSLSDLRKTLSEEVQKLLQQSRELAGSVWRDVAIAIGVLAIRLSHPFCRGLATRDPLRCGRFSRRRPQSPAPTSFFEGAFVTQPSTWSPVHGPRTHLLHHQARRRRKEQDRRHPRAHRRGGLQGRGAPSHAALAEGRRRLLRRSQGSPLLR